MAGLRVGTLVVAAAVLPFADAFTVPSGTLSSLRRGSPLLCPRPFRSGLELGHQQQQQQLSPVGSNQRKERRVGANMVIGVVSALTGPVVALAALGTLGGLGRVVRNMPRYMELQYKYAMQLLAQGGLEPVTDVDKLKQGILDSKEYRYNVLKLFVKYDQDDDGKIPADQLQKILQKEFPSGTIGTTAGGIAVLVAQMDRNKNQVIDVTEFLVTLFPDMTAQDADRLYTQARKDQVSSAYEECKDLTSEYAKTFFLATLAMDKPQARATWAIYAWCRRVDEIVDGPTADPDPEVQRVALDEWMDRLERMSRNEGRRGLDQFDIAFQDMLSKTPGSDLEPYRDMVRGMQMDITDFRYQTWEELYLYCYRVASTVGLMTLPIMGTSSGVTLEEAREPAVALGIALQLTNILRDVGEDARDRGRIYLPMEDLERFGVTEEEIFRWAKEGGAISENYKRMMQFEIDRAMFYYQQAEGGIALLAKGAQLPVAVAGELYKEILHKLVANGYDNFSQRAYLTKEEKFLKVPPLWFKTATGGWSRQPSSGGAEVGREFVESYAKRHGLGSGRELGEREREPV